MSIAIESRFLGHWCGLTKNGGAQLEDQLPRSSPWNYICDGDLSRGDRGYQQRSAGVSKGEVGLRKFAPDAGLAADSKFLLHWFGLSATKNGCLDEELPRPSQWTHFAKDTALVDADTQYVPESGVRAAEVRRHRWCPWRQPVRW